MPFECSPHMGQSFSKLCRKNVKQSIGKCMKLLPREIGVERVTALSRGRFTMGNIHEYVKKKKETRPCKVVKSQGFSISKVAWVADVKKGRGRGNLGARERGGRCSLLPRAFSRALTPFLFPFECLPRTRRLYPRQESQSGLFILHQNETAKKMLLLFPRCWKKDRCWHGRFHDKTKVKGKF